MVTNKPCLETLTSPSFTPAWSSSSSRLTSALRVTNSSSSSWRLVRAASSSVFFHRCPRFFFGVPPGEGFGGPFATCGFLT